MYYSINFTTIFHLKAAHFLSFPSVWSSVWCFFCSYYWNCIHLYICGLRSTLSTLVLSGMLFDLVQITFKTRRFPAINTEMHPSLGGSGLLLSNTHKDAVSHYINTISSLTRTLSALWAPWKTWWPWPCPTKNIWHVTIPLFVVCNCFNHFIQLLTVQYFKSHSKSCLWYDRVQSENGTASFICFFLTTRGLNEPL